MNQSSTLTGLQKSLGGHSPRGLDVVYTKLAVDLQCLEAEDYDSSLQRQVEVLRDAVDSDAVAIALFDAEGQQIERMFVSCATFSPCNPDVLTGSPLADWPWLDQRLNHLRLISLQDTSAPEPYWHLSQSVQADATSSSPTTTGCFSRTKTRN